MIHRALFFYALLCAGMIDAMQQDDTQDALVLAELRQEFNQHRNNPRLLSSIFVRYCRERYTLPIARLKGMPEFRLFGTELQAAIMAQVNEGTMVLPPEIACLVSNFADDDAALDIHYRQGCVVERHLQKTHSDLQSMQRIERDVAQRSRALLDRQSVLNAQVVLVVNQLIRLDEELQLTDAQLAENNRRMQSCIAISQALQVRQSGYARFLTEHSHALHTRILKEQEAIGHLESELDRLRKTPENGESILRLREITIRELAIADHKGAMQNAQNELSAMSSNNEPSALASLLSRLKMSS